MYGILDVICVTRNRVQTENYAYLMESTSLQYFTERYCNVTMVGDLIDDRNYAIGMRKSIAVEIQISLFKIDSQKPGFFFQIISTIMS